MAARNNLTIELTAVAGADGQPAQTTTTTNHQAADTHERRLEIPNYIYLVTQCQIRVSKLKWPPGGCFMCVIVINEYFNFILKSFRIYVCIYVPI